MCAMSGSPAWLRAIQRTLSAWPTDRARGPLLRLAQRYVSASDVFPVEPGVRVAAELSDYMVISAFVGDYQREPMFATSRRLLRPDDIVVDVGANVGLWAL